MLSHMPENGVGVEVGVYQGGFSDQILHTHVGKLHLVDSWRHYDDYGADSCNRCDEDQDKVYQSVWNRFKPEIDSGKVVIHRMFSVDAATQFEDRSLDWVYIDANHRLEAVLSDLRAWAPKIKNGGWLMGHDYSGCPQAKELGFGVKEAVEQFCEESGWKLAALAMDNTISFGLQNAGDER